MREQPWRFDCRVVSSEYYNRQAKTRIVETKLRNEGK